MSEKFTFGSPVRLPKTHKPELAMFPILSATSAYNFMLATWSDEKLKPTSAIFLILSNFPIYRFLRKKKVVDGEILVFYVCSLFTNVPIDKTIEILCNMSFW